MSKYNLEMTLKELMDDKKSYEVLYKYLGDVLGSQMVAPAYNMTINAIKPYAEGIVETEVFDAIEKDLSELN